MMRGNENLAINLYWPNSTFEESLFSSNLQGYSGERPLSHGGLSPMLTVTCMQYPWIHVFQIHAHVFEFFFSQPNQQGNFCFISLHLI